MIILLQLEKPHNSSLVNVQDWQGTLQASPSQRTRREKRVIPSARSSGADWGAGHLHTTQRSSPLPPRWRLLSQIQLKAGVMHIPSLLSAKTSQEDLPIEGVRDSTLPGMVGARIQGFISEIGEETGEPQDSPCFFWGTSSSAKTSLEQSLSLRRTRNMTLMSKVLQFCRLSKGSWRYKNTNLMES